MSSLRKRDQKIETLRGIVIILMVMAHVIGTTAGDGLKVQETSILRWFYCLTENYFLPIFMAISGYTYAIKPINRDNLKSIFFSKLERLFYPLIFVSSLQYLIRYITPGTNSRRALTDIWKIYFFSFDQFWYLQALILVLILMILIDYFRLIEKMSHLLLLYTLAFLFPILLPFRTTFFSFSGFLYLWSFFVLGILIYKKKELLQKNKLQIFLIIAFIATIIAQQFIYFDPSIKMDRTDLLGVIFGTIGTLFAFAFMKINKALAWIGGYSFEIFLFHVFGQAGSRILFKMMGLNNIFLLFMINLLFGIFLPIFISKVLRKNSISRKYLLGMK